MQTIDKYIKDYFSSLQIEDNPYSIYQQIISPKLKDKIIFVEIKDHILFVKALHPSYKQLFKMEELKFLSDIQKALPSYDIKKIKYKN